MNAVGGVEDPPLVLVISVGKRPSFHAAVRHALADLVAGSRCSLSEISRTASPPADTGSDTGWTRRPAYQEVCAKARRYLAEALPHAEIRLINVETLNRAADALSDQTRGNLPPPLLLVVRRR